jgi:myo-inositol-1(or 4)-monophosphatase
LPASDPPIDLARERAVLEAAMREAGVLALKTFQAPLKSWTKAHSSPVTEADIAVDNLLRERLVGARSDLGWLSEESEDVPSRRQAERLWIVDPIDGTRSYIAGRSDWAISAALVVRGRPVVAAVFAPATDEFFAATAGAGATCNGQRIATSTGDRLAGSKVAGPKSLVNAVAALVPDIVAVPRIGSLALRLIRVAQGELDIGFGSASSYDWDLAGADLLVHEAGGAMTTWMGRTLTYNRAELTHGALVAAGADRHAALIALARDRLTEFA